MPGLGTLINVAGIVIGGLLGLCFGKLLQERHQQTLCRVCGVSTLFIGIAGALEGMMQVQGTGLISGKALMIVGARQVGKSYIVEEFCKAGADILTVHVEADTPENTLAAIEKIRALGVKPGIVLKPKTPAEALAPYLDKVDLVLVMTVEPGFGGQKFMADMMPKLKQLRAMLDEVNPTCHLEVDGGVDAETCKLCKENGADVLVAGSAFYKAADRAALTKIIEA